MSSSPAVPSAPIPVRQSRAARIRQVVVTLLAPLGLFAAGSAYAQNLLPNPDFAFDAGGWTLTSGSGSIAYESAGGWPLGVFSPGSLLVTNTGISEVRVTSDCIPLTFSQRNSLYLASLHVYPIPAAGISTNSSVSVLQYGTGDCSGGGGGGFNTDVAAGTWSQVKTTRFLDSNTLAVKFAVGFSKNVADTAQARFDGFYLGHWVKGDFDQDGYADLVLRNVNGNDHQLWFMGGTWRATSAAVTPDVDSADWNLVATDDFDLDGKSDVIVRDTLTGDVRVWELDGTTRAGEGTILTPGPDWDLTATADFSVTPYVPGVGHDGRPDILWRNRFTQKLLVWTMDGLFKTGEIVPSPDQAADANWSVAAALDFNADKNIDLLWYNATTGKIVIWFMDSLVHRTTGTFTNPANAGSNDWKVVAAGDYGRGAGGALNTPDIVWRNITSGKLVVWHMTQETRTSSVFMYPNAPNPALGWTVVGPK